VFQFRDPGFETLDQGSQFDVLRYQPGIIGDQSGVLGRQSGALSE
jgi:hypothetical protein